MAARPAAQLNAATLAQDLQRLLRSLAASSNPEAFLQLARAFCDLITEVGGSPRFVTTLAKIHNIVPGNLYAGVPQAMGRALKGFRVELKAQRIHDPDLAPSASIAASLAHTDCLIVLLRERGVLATDALASG